MSDLREAAQQALDALAGYRREMNLIRGESYMHGQPCDAEIALRAALAQQAERAQEPAGWFEGPFGAFRANQLYKIAWPASTVAWSIPLYAALGQDQDPELSAALGWPGGISDPVLDRKTLLQQVARLVERAHGIEEEE